LGNKKNHENLRQCTRGTLQHKGVSTLDIEVGKNDEVEIAILT